MYYYYIDTRTNQKIDKLNTLNLITKFNLKVLQTIISIKNNIVLLIYLLYKVQL